MSNEEKTRDCQLTPITSYLDQVKLIQLNSSVFDICTAAAALLTVADGQTCFCDGWHDQVRPYGGSYRQGGRAIKPVLQGLLLAHRTDRPWSSRPVIPGRPCMCGLCVHTSRG